MARKVLEGIRVLDFSQMGVAPGAAAMLGDLGADVIHVEQLGTGDQVRGLTRVVGNSTEMAHGKTALFEYFGRNKRGIAIDYMSLRCGEIIRKLIEKCDVFTTSFLPDQVQRFGIDYPTLSAINPRLVYASVSVFGHEGPEKDARGFDICGLARSGMLASCGDTGSSVPGTLPPGMADQLASTWLFIGVLAALMARERFGIGQEVRGSLTGPMINLQAFTLMIQLQSSSELSFRLPVDKRPLPVRFFECQDGKWIQLSTLRDLDWIRLVRAIGLPELEHDPECDTYIKRSEAKLHTKVAGLLAERFRSRPRKEWLEILYEATVPMAPVNSLVDLQADPMILANHFVMEYDHPDLGKIKLPGFPTGLTATPASMDRQAPEIGEHTEEILTDVCGYSWDDITRLRSEGLI